MRHRISDSESEESHPAFRRGSLLLNKIQRRIQVPDLPVSQDNNVCGMICPRRIENGLEGRQKAGSAHICFESARDIGQCSSEVCIGIPLRSRPERVNGVAEAPNIEMALLWKTLEKETHR